MIEAVKRKNREQRIIECPKNKVALMRLLMVRAKLEQEELYGSYDESRSQRIERIGERVSYILGLSDGGAEE